MAIFQQSGKEEGLPFSNTWGYAWAFRAARSPTGLLTTAEASGVPFLPHGPQDLAKTVHWLVESPELCSRLRSLPNDGTEPWGKVERLKHFQTRRHGLLLTWVCISWGPCTFLNVPHCSLIYTTALLFILFQLGSCRKYCIPFSTICASYFGQRIL